jgi:hypothetical protein
MNDIVFGIYCTSFLSLCLCHYQSLLIVPNDMRNSISPAVSGCQSSWQALRAVSLLIPVPILYPQRGTSSNHGLSGACVIKNGAPFGGVARASGSDLIGCEDTVRWIYYRLILLGSCQSIYNSIVD